MFRKSCKRTAKSEVKKWYTAVSEVFKGRF